MNTSFRFVARRLRLCVTGITLVGLMAFTHASEPVLRDGDLIAICGDSITEQKLYSLFIEQYLVLCQPLDKITTVQFGYGGERAPAFNSRLEKRVLPFKPTVATTCYGMNDGNYTEVNDATVTNYRNAMTAAVKKLKAGGVRTIIVGSPGVVDTAHYKRTPNASIYNHTLSVLAQVAREVAKSEGVIYADVYGIMMDAMTKAKAALGQEYPIAGDGIHPSANGQLAMAYAFLKAMGIDGHIGTLNLDYEAGSATATTGHRVTGYKNGVLDIESTRYPYCYTGTSTGRDTLAMSAFLPFNEELNRFILVVKNAPTRATVQWGNASKEFSATQLATGINLAAEFSDNPFSAPFAKATQVLKQQQDFETLGIKGLIEPIDRSAHALPEAAAHFEAIHDLILARAKTMRETSTAAAQPVNHRITITAVAR